MPRPPEQHLADQPQPGPSTPGCPAPRSAAGDDAQLAAQVAAVHEQPKGRSPWRSCGLSGGSAGAGSGPARSFRSREVTVARPPAVTRAVVLPESTCCRSANRTTHSKTSTSSSSTNPRRHIADEHQRARAGPLPKETFPIGHGEVFRVPWPNGAGKATTVRTLRTPTASRIGLRDRGRDLPRPCRVIYQSDITLGSARMAGATALTDAYRRPHRNDSIAPRDRA